MKSEWTVKIFWCRYGIDSVNAAAIQELKHGLVAIIDSSLVTYELCQETQTSHSTFKFSRRDFHLLTLCHIIQQLLWSF